MKRDNHSWIPENIFIKCLYSTYRTVSPEWFYSDEETDYCNLVLICSGQGVFTCRNEVKTVKKGDIVYFPHGVRRSMRADGGNLVFRSFNFRYRLLFEHKLDWWLENPALPLDFITKTEDNALFYRIEELFERIQRAYTVKRYAASFEMRFYATEILSLILSQSGRDVTYSERNTVNKSIEYMSKNFTRKITLEELAAISKKSVSYYGKTFKKVLGVTPIEYLLSMRISYAKKLLKNGTSVTETAAMCGFSNLYYFSKAFRSREHMSPSEYIRHHSDKNTE